MEQEASLFSAFKSWMEKPNGVENDPKTLVVILRYICLLIIPYSLSMGFMMLAFTKRAYSSVFFIGTFAGLLLFRNLLSKPVRPIFITVIIMLLLGAIVPTFMFGWDLGFQYLLYTALLLLLFNSRLGTPQKRLFCLIALVLVILLEVCIHGPLSGVLNDRIIAGSIQIILGNEIFFVLSISAIGLVIAEVSLDSEHELVMYNAKLKDDAGTDPLTGLANRRNMREQLAGIAALTGTADSRIVTVAMGDIDFFKKVNDTYGHDAGDLILRDISDLLVAFMGDRGLVSRWGGEEFLLVFIDLNGDEVFTELDTFLHRLAKRSFDFKGTDISVTMTFGVSEYDAGPDFTKTIKEADEKLYLGKQSGRNRAIF